MKTLVRLMSLAMVGTILVAGCSGAAQQSANPTATVPAVVPTTASVATTAPAAATAVPAQPTKALAQATNAPATQAPSAGKVTITYANWNLGTEAENNVNRQMIKAYTDAHPNVTVKIVDIDGSKWDADLTAHAAKGELPDVFMANNVPLYVQNGWVADVTELTKSDPDWPKIPKNLTDAFTYSGKVLGIPAGQFIMGYFVNNDLYDAANLNAPAYGVSPDDFFKVAGKLNNPSKHILGLDETGPIQGWYPSTQDSKLNFYSFNGEKMNYNSAAFKAAVAKTAEIMPYTWQGLTPEQQGTFKSKGPWELFLNQEVGVRWDASWTIPDLVKNAKFDWDFVGIPGGNQAIVFDAMVISKTAKDMKAAYDFARWMTFSSQGYAKQAELAKAAGSAPNLPIAVDETSLAQYKAFVDKPGINKALANLDNSLLESLAKVVPGYIQARWEGKPGIDIGSEKDVTIGWIMDNAATGKFKYEDYSGKLEEFANKIMTDARAATNK